MSLLTRITAIVVLLIGIYYFKSSPKIGKVVVTKSGPIRGIISASRDGREFYEWLGIPYAAPPIGDLRFASPKPVKAWDSMRDASSYGAMCAQTYALVLLQVGHEDCLTLNVHVSKLDDTSKLLPVMVFIHGGHYMSGGSHEYRPDYFMDHDVILVTLNYRLGVLGFLSTGDESISGNMGLKDQALAVKWVHSNIKAFGGDPNRITLIGESAGASSTHYQMISAKTKGLIRKAIALSGTAGAPWGFTPPEVGHAKSKQIAEFFQCPTDTAELLTKCLQEVPVSDLLSMLKDDMKFMLGLFPHRYGYFFAPTVETDHPDAFLTEHPLQVLEQGRAQKIPLLTGVTADDGLVSAFSFYKNPQNMKAFEDNWEERISDVCNLRMRNKSQVAQLIKEFYFPPDKSLTYKDKLEGFKTLFGDCFFNFRIHRDADLQRKFSPLYLYFFNVTGGPSSTSILTDYRDVFHPVIDFGLSFAKMYVREILLGIPREDLSVNHSDDVLLAFPAFTTIRKGHEFYNLSKSWVKFLVDFASDVPTDFMGEELTPVPAKGLWKYLHINKQPELISPKFVERVEFLRSIGVQQIPV